MNSGFILRRDPDLVRAPDQAFVSQARLEANPPPERGYWELAPDLAVEIISPEDRAGEIEEKVRDYLQAGVRLVWLLYPLTRRAHVYAADGSVRVILEERELDGEDVLPGFRAPLAELFD